MISVNGRGHFEQKLYASPTIVLDEEGNLTYQPSQKCTTVLIPEIGEDSTRVSTEDDVVQLRRSYVHLKTDFAKGLNSKRITIDRNGGVYTIPETNKLLRNSIFTLQLI